MGSNNVVDVLVVGAGASGAAFSWSLASAGIGVMCLEQGRWVNGEEYPANRIDWELSRTKHFAKDPNVRNLPEDYPINSINSPITPLMYNAVGGSTIHWSGQFPRLKPSDFRVKSLDGVGDDWPLDYYSLEKYFDLNDKMTGVAGITGDPMYPGKSSRQTPPLPLGKAGNAIVKGLDKLGWHWWPSDAAILTTTYNNRLPCNNCGPCELGCARQSKASTDITYWPKAIHAGAILKTHSRVKEITLSSKGLADGVLYVDPEGKIQKQHARIVVLACNGIGTPRLLLNSVSNQFPGGLANRNGLVGRNLMFHPYAMVMGVFEEDLESYKGPASCSIISQEFHETDLTQGFVRGFTFQVGRGGAPLHTALGSQPGHRIPWGENHRKVFDQRYGHNLNISVCVEDLPEKNNRVFLDHDLKDTDGIPGARIEYQVSLNSSKIMERGIEKAKEALDAAGAYDVVVNPLLRESGWHLLGTTKMGTNTETSVVDGVGRAHDVKNLFIVDGSVFVTSGAVNPTSTIQAVALYIANHIKNNSRHLLD
jgi:choline dehydrogenase-like flavoprotein